jgi:hypothetical protein
MEEREVFLYVPLGKQVDAIEKGAKFQRKSFFDSSVTSTFYIDIDSSNENNNRLLSVTYGKDSKIAKEKEKNILLEWRYLIKHGDNFACLRMAKLNGFPKDDDLMADLFLKFRCYKSRGDYPVSWEHLREYVPSFDEKFGVDRYLKLHRDYALEGDMVSAINLSNMPMIDKYFLYFVYEICE